MNNSVSLVMVAELNTSEMGLPEIIWNICGYKNNEKVWPLQTLFLNKLSIHVFAGRLILDESINLCWMVEFLVL